MAAQWTKEKWDVLHRQASRRQQSSKPQPWPTTQAHRLKSVWTGHLRLWPLCCKVCSSKGSDKPEEGPPGSRGIWDSGAGRGYSIQCFHYNSCREAMKSKVGLSTIKGLCLPAMWPGQSTTGYPSFCFLTSDATPETSGEPLSAQCHSIVLYQETSTP